MDACCVILILVFLVPFLLYALYKIGNFLLIKARLHRWRNAPKDKVILHGFPRPKVSPNLSPYVLKLESFLRLAGIAYEFDDTTPFGPKGKAPWITYQSKHIGDSQLIIEFLKKEFGADVNGTYSKEQIAIGTAVRIMLEEYLIWGLGFERLGTGRKHVQTLTSKAPPAIIYISGHIVKWRSQFQGVGLHSDEERWALMKSVVQAVSSILGEKKYILGEQISEADCSVFGFMAQLTWGLPKSSYEEAIKGEMNNIEDYCHRVKEKLWTDQEWQNSLEV